MTNIKIKNSFADKTTREMTIGNFEDSIISAAEVKIKIQNINSNVSDISNIYLSNGGASFTGITYAEINIETQNLIPF